MSKLKDELKKAEDATKDILSCVSFDFLTQDSFKSLSITFDFIKYEQINCKGIKFNDYFNSAIATITELTNCGYQIYTCPLNGLMESNIWPDVFHLINTKSPGLIEKSLNHSVWSVDHSDQSVSLAA